eukprot:m.92523 g.92523  ORF g.92523 m.92523 type:complete len:134 (+) comp13356_c0_seq1:1108-1509(+)
MIAQRRKRHSDRAHMMSMTTTTMMMMTRRTKMIITITSVVITLEVAVTLEVVTLKVDMVALVGVAVVCPCVRIVVLKQQQMIACSICVDTAASFQLAVVTEANVDGMTNIIYIQSYCPRKEKPTIVHNNKGFI